MRTGSYMQDMTYRSVSFPLQLRKICIETTCLIFSTQCLWIITTS